MANRKKKIKTLKGISKDTEELFTKEVEESLKEMIKEGLLAYIVSKDNEKIEGSYINASQVIVKCPHCNNLVNVGKKNPHPRDSEEEVIEGIEDGIKKGYIKEVATSEEDERKFKISEDGEKYVKESLLKDRSARLFLWNLMYNFSKNKENNPDYYKIMMDSVFYLYEETKSYDIIDDIIESVKDGTLKGIEINNPVEFKKLAIEYIIKRKEVKK